MSEEAELEEEAKLELAGFKEWLEEEKGPLDVMTVDQVAAYLQVGARSIYNMAAAGEIPAAKVAGQWRFYRPEVDRWLVELSRANTSHREGEKVATNGKV